MKELTSRERVSKALNHQEPDRVPVDLGGYQSGITAYAYERLKEKLRITSPTQIMERNQQLAEIEEEVLQRFGVDTRYVFLRPSSHWDPQERPDHSYRGEWGTRWRKPESSFYYDPVEFPLTSVSIKDLETYPWPDPDDLSRVQGLREEARSIREDTSYALCTTVSGVFEQSWYLMGLERTLIEIKENPALVENLLDKVLEIEIGIYGHFLNEVGDYLDLMEIWEDISTQNGPLIAPSAYREIIKPRTRELIQFIRGKTKAKIALHSCGSVSWALEDLIEIGVEVLNPVQVAAAAMDTRQLKEKYGDRLSFWGGIDTQGVLPRGSTKDVREEVRKRINDLAPGGGYLLAAVHNIQPDVPPENILTMFEACQEYGKYPKPARGGCPGSRKF